MYVREVLALALILILINVTIITAISDYEANDSVDTVLKVLEANANDRGKRFSIYVAGRWIELDRYIIDRLVGLDPMHLFAYAFIDNEWVSLPIKVYDECVEIYGKVSEREPVGIYCRVPERIGFSTRVLIKAPPEIPRDVDKDAILRNLDRLPPSFRGSKAFIVKLSVESHGKVFAFTIVLLHHPVLVNPYIYELSERHSSYHAWFELWGTQKLIEIVKTLNLSIDSTELLNTITNRVLHSKILQIHPMLVPDDVAPQYNILELIQPYMTWNGSVELSTPSSSWTEIIEAKLRTTLPQNRYGDPNSYTAALGMYVTLKKVEGSSPPCLARIKLYLEGSSTPYHVETYTLDPSMANLLNFYTYFYPYEVSNGRIIKVVVELKGCSGRWNANVFYAYALQYLSQTPTVVKEWRYYLEPSTTLLELSASELANWKAFAISIPFVSGAGYYLEDPLIEEKYMGLEIENAYDSSCGVYAKLCIADRCSQQEFIAPGTRSTLWIYVDDSLARRLLLQFENAKPYALMQLELRAVCRSGSITLKVRGVGNPLRFYVIPPFTGFNTIDDVYEQTTLYSDPQAVDYEYVVRGGASAGGVSSCRDSMVSTSCIHIAQSLTVYTYDDYVNEPYLHVPTIIEIHGEITKSSPHAWSYTVDKIIVEARSIMGIEPAAIRVEGSIPSKLTEISLSIASKFVPGLSILTSYVLDVYSFVAWVWNTYVATEPVTISHRYASDKMVIEIDTNPFGIIERLTMRISTDIEFDTHHRTTTVTGCFRYRQGYAYSVEYCMHAIAKVMVGA